MKNLLIDTNIYSYAMRGDAEIIKVLQHVQQISICAVSIGELLSGFKAGAKENKQGRIRSVFGFSSRSIA